MAVMFTLPQTIKSAFVRVITKLFFTIKLAAINFYRYIRVDNVLWRLLPHSKSCRTRHARLRPQTNLDNRIESTVCLYINSMFWVRLQKQNIELVPTQLTLCKRYPRLCFTVQRYRLVDFSSCMWFGHAIYKNARCLHWLLPLWYIQVCYSDFQVIVIYLQVARPTTWLFEKNLLYNVCWTTLTFT